MPMRVSQCPQLSQSKCRPPEAQAQPMCCPKCPAAGVGAGADGLPVPANIKDQMPRLAAMRQSLAANIGRDAVQLRLKASMDLRNALGMSFAAMLDWALVALVVAVLFFG